MNKRLFQALLIAGFTGIAILIAGVLAVTTSSPETVEQKPLVTPVQVIEAQSGDEEILITAYGTVEQTRQLKLQTEVKGRIVELNPNLNLGGMIAKGEVLLKLDPKEYQAAVKLAKAEVANAEAELKIEQGRSWIAAKEYELLENSVEGETLISDLSEQLVLRQPQTASREAALEGTIGRLEQMELDLERTTLKAPFNLAVITESVELGQVVSPGQTLATLVTTDYFIVIATLPMEQLHWIYKRGSHPQVKVFIESGKRKDLMKIGNVVRVIPLVSKEGRMVRLAITVIDPLDLNLPIVKRHPLLLDSYVRIEIPGPVLSHTYKIPREAIRDNDSVWIIDHENQLQIKPIHIVHQYADTVLIDEGIEEGDRIITSRLGVPVPGMALRVIEPKTLELEK